MHHRLHRHIHSFRFAWEGLLYTWRQEPNFLVHLLISLIVISLALLFKISQMELIVLFIMITIGLATELANTAIEAVTDLVTKEHQLEAKIAKDVSAAMVLVIAIGSLTVAIIIFTPYLIKLVA